MKSDFFERYRAEAADVLDAILIHSRECIKLVSLDAELDYVNANGLKALGCNDAIQLLGKNWRELWPETERPRIDASIEGARRGESTAFVAWCPNFSGENRLWDVSVTPVTNEDRGVTHILAISRDVTAQKAQREDERMRREVAEHEADFAGDVAREMGHRFKNQLAVIGAIAKLLARHTGDARELARKLEEKLLAMARAQDLITARQDQPIPADEAVAYVLAASGAGDRVRVLECPKVLLGDETIQQLALLLNELQTNALKHGALRSPDGRIELTGTLGDGALSLVWHERCAEPVIPADQGNGGFQLIRRIGAVGAKRPRITWDDHGIVVEFHLRTTN